MEDNKDTGPCCNNDPCTTPDAKTADCDAKADDCCSTDTSCGDKE